MVVLGLLGMTINAQAQTSKSKKAKPMESKQEVIVTAPHHVQVSQEGAGNNIQIQQSERSSDSTTLVTTIIQDGTNRVIMVQDTLPGQKARHQVQIHQSGQGNTAQVSQQGSGNKVVIKQGSN
ncbi:hypothetical protein GCM10027275_06470 [Rhabdobacter roseus]